MTQLSQSAAVGLGIARARLVLAVVFASVIGVLIPASAMGGPPSDETLSFTTFVPCAGEYVVIEGTLRTMEVRRPDGGLVARQIWTKAHGSGYQDVGGVLTPTGTKWVYSAVSAVDYKFTDVGTSWWSHYVSRLTSRGKAPNLRVTIISAGVSNDETGEFDVRVEKHTVTCA